MKVNQDFSVKMKQIPQEHATQTRSTQFQQVLQTSQSQMQLGQLHSLLETIDKAGERLQRSRNFRDLLKYKNLVQSFLKETVNFGLSLKSSTTWNEVGQGRILKIVEQIDASLVELTDEMLKKEKDHIRILGLIGEIKGLLINLYT